VSWLLPSLAAALAGLFLVLAFRVGVAEAGPEGEGDDLRAQGPDAHPWLAQALDALPEPLVVVDAALRVLLRNRAAREWNVPAFPEFREPAPGEPGLPESLVRALEHVRATRQPFASTQAHVPPGGAPRHLEVLSAPLWEADGTLAGLVQSIRDATDRVEAYAQLSQAKRQWEVTFDAVPDLIFLRDRSYRILRCNRALAERLGLHPRDVVGRRCHELLCGLPGPPEAGEGCPCGNPDTRAEAPHPRMVDLRLGGELLVTASPLPGPDGEPEGAVVVAREVSAAAALERERARAQHLESLGVLAGGLAHDFNNLLTGIVGNLSLARRDLAPESRGYRRLQEAEDACFHARDLTRQLLTFAKGGEPIKRVFSLADNLGAWAGFALAGSNVRPRVEVAPGLPPVDADEGQIHQVVNNLVLNAQQAMPRGGTVGLRAEALTLGEGNGLPLAPGRYVRLTVADEGVGIPPEHLPKVFDPYFTTKQTGSGLGLSTAYSIVRRHGGHIGVRSELGRGTAFTVYLPAAAETPGAPEGREAPVPAGNGKVLVMDDEAMLRDLLAELLPELGYEARFAADGAEAVALYQEAQAEGRPFDAVLLDLTVPGGMGGREALGELRRLDPGVRAVASSGYAFDTGSPQDQGAGFVAAISKPYRPSDLAAVLAKAVGRHAGSPRRETPRRPDV
jgi:signal transduction histidine kinase/CheY-like chemotaxis protein